MTADTSPLEHRSAAPVSTEDRIAVVDVIRGCALLGILLMNIVEFGMPGAAYDNPTVWGGDTGADYWAWAINSVFFEGKMRALFSMLFGAGVILLTGRADARGAAEQTGDIHARRNLWLVAFGLLDSWVLLWSGDVLYSYGLIGLALYPFRKLSARSLIIVAIIAFATAIPREIAGERHHREQQALAAQAAAATARGEKPTSEQEEALAGWNRYLSFVRPDADQIQKTLEHNRAGYLAWRSEVGDEVRWFQSKGLYKWGISDMGAMMLLGMGLTKLGFFTGRLPTRRYAQLALAGYAVGLPIAVWRAKAMTDSGFDPVQTAGPGLVYDPARVMVAIAHASLITLVFRSGAVAWLAARLRAVGQMALTNYLSQSLLCTLFFNGYGLGYYAELSRHQLYYVVAAVWVIQLAWSPWWLRRFRFGPVEWLWRWLTYRTWPRMRREAA